MSVDAFVGRRIATARKLANLTGEELAIQAEISHEVLHLYEGGIERVRPEHLLRIANATGQAISFFFPSTAA